MTVQTLLLVLLAALLHAGWNVLAKRAAVHETISFVWLTSFASTLLYAPVLLVAIVVLDLPLPDMAGLGAILITGVLHVAYFILLQRGYRAGDLSLVYPLARGSGPLLTVVVAVVLFSERPGPLGFLGIACIIAGIFTAVGLRMHGVHHAAKSVGYGLATGAAIAAYTLWDKHAVSALMLSPIVYDFGRNVAQSVLMTPLAFGRGPQIRHAWTHARKEVIGIATLSPLAYILVLFAMVSTPVSLVAPAREISIVIGAFLGARYFAEGHTTQRVAAAFLMFAGIVALALS